MSAGIPGSQLTWMDARVRGVPVTPRMGKPVEINALWFNALRLMDTWSRRLNRPVMDYRRSAEKVYESFNRRFWNGDLGHLYDVVDGDDGDDPKLRPNQIFSIALTYPTLDARRWGAVLDSVDDKLLTRVGLRTLSPDDPAYVGKYGGSQRQRDGAYHQGTVWPWLLGAYADAARRAGRDLTRLRATLEQLTQSSSGVGLGYIGEVFDGDPPHAPGGCIAQAWSVAEVLRAWQRISQE